MPHFTLEYSANLDGKTDIRGLCQEILKTALATGVFEIGAVRVRAIRCEHYAIADDIPGNGFIDLSLRLAEGRDLKVRQKIGEAVFAAMTNYLAPLFETKNFALSFEIREIDAALSYKKNAIHSRLRKS
jgi:5-carboxymethyl-2-hydroxymuconate isomerase